MICFARKVLLPLPERFHDFVQSLGFFQIMFESTVNLVNKICFYAWLLEVEWLYERPPIGILTVRQLESLILYLAALLAVRNELQIGLLLTVRLERLP